jgi:hypothetical protein
MTCPASATAVFSLLPVPRRIASNSALESASGPSDNSRSRGLSSGGSCLMVYLRPCTSVFYIIQVTAVRIQVSAASAVMRVSSNSALLRGARRDRQAGQRRVELGLPFFARSDVPPVSVAHQIAPVPGSRMQQHHRLARAQQQGDLQHKDVSTTATERLPSGALLAVQQPCRSIGTPRLSPILTAQRRS